MAFIFLNFICSFLIINLNCILIFQVFSRINFFSKTTYLPSLLYFFLLSFTTFKGVDFNIITDAFLLLIIDQIMKLDQNHTGVHVAFKSGLLIGFSACFMPSNLLLILVVFIGLNLVRAFIWKEWFLACLGVVIPLVFVVVLNFVLLNDLVYFPAFSAYEPLKEFVYIDYVKIGLLILFLIAGLGDLKNFFAHNTALIRNRMVLLFYVLLVVLIVTVIDFAFFSELSYGVVIPIALLYSVSAVTKKADSYISLLLTIILFVNITFLFL